MPSSRTARRLAVGGRATARVPAVSLRAPELEAPSGRVEVHRQLLLERCELVAELEQAEVEEALGVALVRLAVRPRNGCAALGARHVGGLWERDSHPRW